MLTRRLLAAVLALAGVAGPLTAPAPAGAVPGALAPGPGGFVAVAPFRLVDTREPAGSKAVAYAGPRFGASEVDTFQVYTPADVSLPPGGVGAVVLNVTAVGADGPGFLTLWPADQPQPFASVLNYRGGDVVPNAVTVGLSADLRFSVYSKVGLHLVIDVMGVYAAAPNGPGGGGFSGVVPTRLLDTRAASAIGAVTTTAEPGGGVTTSGLAVTGGVVPPTAAAVVLNVTAVPIPGRRSAGYVTAYPDGIARPTASNVNYDGTVDVANQVTVKVGAGGRVALFSQTAVDLVVDVMGYYAAGAPVPGGFVAINPTRMADTRLPATGGYVYDPATSSFVVSVVDRAGIPTAAEAAAANVTVTAPSGDGYVTVWPDMLPRPTASNLNYLDGQTVPNAVTVGLGATGGIELFSKVPTDLVVDVNGWFTSPYRTA